MRLIINADDFGITEKVSDAIVTCHLAGSVTSTTLMTNMAAAAYAAEQARGVPELAVGLHFNLTLGRPLSAAGALFTDAGGSFCSRYQLLMRIPRKRGVKLALREELEAQWERALELGVQPTHIDSHQHVHVSSVIFDVVAAFALKKNVPLRVPWSWPGRSDRGLKRRIKSAVLRRSNLRNHRLWAPLGLKTNSGFGSVFDLAGTGERVNVELYRLLLSAWESAENQQLVELMVHPEICDKQLSGLVGITDFGERDYQLLSDKSICKQLFSKYQLCDYRALR